MKRLSFVSVLAVLLCSCSGEPEQPASVSSAPPAANVPGDAGDSDSGAASETAQAPPVTDNSDSGIESVPPPVATGDDSDLADNGQPEPPAETVTPEDAVTPPPVAASDRGKRGSSAGKKPPAPEPAPLVPAFPSSLASVGLSTGDLIPEIEGHDIEGVDFKLSDYKGKVIMLDFWGDW